MLRWESNTERQSRQGTEGEKKRERKPEYNEGRNTAKSRWRLTSRDYSSDNDRLQTRRIFA